MKDSVPPVTRVIIGPALMVDAQFHKIKIVAGLAATALGIVIGIDGQNGIARFGAIPATVCRLIACLVMTEQVK